MKVALAGSVSSSWYALEALIRAGVEVTGVLGLHESKAATVSDYRPLRFLAEDASVPFCPFVRIADPAVEAFLRRHPPDALWVIGLSQLVPPNLLALAPEGAIGFHPTPLPKGRGRAPVAWTLLLDQPAAANLFYLTDEPDAGDIIAQRAVPVLPDDYSEDLILRTNLVLAEMIRDLSSQIRSGSLPRTPQDHSQATYYPRRTPDDGRIDWTRSTADIYRLIRAAGRPYPGAFTSLESQRLIVWRGRPVEAAMIATSIPASPGVVVVTQDGPGPFVRTGDGFLLLQEIAIAGACCDVAVLRDGITLD